MCTISEQGVRRVHAKAYLLVENRDSGRGCNLVRKPSDEIRVSSVFVARKNYYTDDKSNSKFKRDTTQKDYGQEGRYIYVARSMEYNPRLPSGTAVVQQRNCQ